ncbi:MAG: Nramp family divalent metal transporter [Bacteroidota bacterium]
MNKNSESILKRLGKLVVSVGPAFFVVGYTIGTGSIVTMASAGSRYGMSLLWVLILACAFAFVLLEAYGKYSLFTGEGALFGIKTHIKGGRYISLTVLVGLIFVEVLALVGIMGIISDLIHDWTGMLFGGKGWNPVWVAVVIVIIIYSLILMGKYSIFEKVLILFVGIMGLSFLLTFFLIPPDASEFMKGMIPSIPEQANAAILIAAIVGTTFTAPTFVVRSILMKEKKWDAGQLKHAKKDAATGAIMMFLVSMAVMAAAAGTLYIIGRPVDKVITMVELLEPLLGRFAVSIFVTGILGAALSSMIPILMLAPLLISDYQNKPVQYKGPQFRILTGVAILFGLLVPILKFKPVFVMIVSQAFQVFLLPIVVLAMMYLINRKDLMKENRAGLWMNASLVIIVVFTLIISWQAVVGLIESFSTMF